ncbi:MAG: class I SAM-dependent methyltransferase [Rhodobacteraceae bacterium]|nr:class I SAM-dependent methyltransferase [Paracoccaceae bacterium]
MTALKAIIEAEIAAQGPMLLSRYMELCLSHPEHGYYMQQQPFGVEGDFTTAPEISQMFGELIGLWLVHMWQESGAPDRFVLLELGPGRGTLMADILRVAKLAPAFLEAAQVYLLETSTRLQAVQRAALGDVRHIERLEDLPEGPVFAVANEFFDALPIRQFVKNDFGWQERLVVAGLTWRLSNTVQRPDLDKSFAGLETGRIVEVAEAGHAVANALTTRLATQGGAALVIDYGDYDGTGDTFQAVQKHKKVGVFSAPGAADLTAHVRFKDLVQNGVAHGFSTQGDFLTRLGIEARKQTLEAAGAKGLSAELARLTGSEEMGDLFKVLALVPEGYVEIAGFENGA